MVTSQGSARGLNLRCQPLRQLQISTRAQHQKRHVPTDPLVRAALPVVPLSAAFRQEHTKLLPNLALRRAISRLVESGKLDESAVKEWRDSHAELERRAAGAAREQALARFPPGTRVELQVVLKVCNPPAAELPTGDFLVDVHAAVLGAGLFSQGVSAGRMLLHALSARRVLRAVRPVPDHPAFREFLAASRDDAPLPPAPIPSETLLTAVLGKPDGDDENAGESKEVVSAIRHVVRRLACTGGMPPGVREEWEALDAELHRRRRRCQAMALRHQMQGRLLKLHAEVESVNAQGAFLLRFASLAEEETTRAVPSTSGANATGDASSSSTTSASAVGSDVDEANIGDNPGAPTAQVPGDFTGMCEASAITTREVGASEEGEGEVGGGGLFLRFFEA